MAISNVRQEQNGDSKRVVTGRISDSDNPIGPFVIDCGFRATKVRAINRTTLSEWTYFDGMRGTLAANFPLAYKRLAAGTLTRETNNAEAFVINDRSVTFPSGIALINEVVDYIIEG